MTGGVLRGAGKQLVGALCNLVGFYFIGVPIGVSLMFAVNLGIVGERRLESVCSCNVCLCFSPVCPLTFRKASNSALSVSGLWIGFVVCVLMQVIFFITYLCKLDWRKAAEEVRALLNPLDLSECIFQMYLRWTGSVNVSDQALVRAGVQIKEEKDMVAMEELGKC